MIEGRINVDGQWWDVSIEKLIPDDLPSDEKIAKIRGVIKGLTSAKMISRVGSSPPVPTNGRDLPKANPSPTASDNAGFVLPPPFCDLHRAEMKVSKVQKKPGFIQYFCPKEFGEGYCKRRASVEEMSGMPDFWEVK